MRPPQALRPRSRIRLEVLPQKGAGRSEPGDL